MNPEKKIIKHQFNKLTNPISKTYHKKLFIVIHLLLSTTSFSQLENFSFSVLYKPQSIYNGVSSISSTQESFYVASEEILKKLENLGNEIKTFERNEFKLKSVIRTGEIRLDSIIHFTQKSFFLNKNTYNKYKLLSVGGGFIEKNGQLNFDSLDTESQTDNKFEIEFLNQFQHFELFPTTNLNVGDSFSIEFPITLKFGEIELSFKAKSKYEVEEVIDSSAYFRMEMKINNVKFISKYPIEMNGTLNGILEYDIKNQFFVFAIIDSRTLTSIKFPEADYLIETKMNFYTERELIKNNR